MVIIPNRTLEPYFDVRASYGQPEIVDKKNHEIYHLKPYSSRTFKALYASLSWFRVFCCNE